MVFPNHTGKIACIQAMFSDVRQQQTVMSDRIEDVRYGLFYPEQFCIKYNRMERDFDSAEDTKSYAETLTKT